MPVPGSESPEPEQTPLLPARMLNEFVYCPRLAYLEWVQGEWAESGDTVEGRIVHRRVDRPGGKPPRTDAQPDEEPEVPATIHVRSMQLQSARLGIAAKLDLAEFDGLRALPVDYKRGRRPHVAGGAWEPERVQLCAQAMLLEEAGYSCPEGVLYFSGSKERVRVVFDESLRALTMDAVTRARAMADGGVIPPPLEDSPKCVRCSLSAICLPDEVRFLRSGDSQPARPLAVSRHAGLPVYVQARGAKIAKVGETLEISVDDQKVTTARLGDVSQVVLQGAVYLTSPALHELMARGIPVTWSSAGGWFLGHTVGLGHRNVELRTAQYKASFDESHCLRLAQGLVVAKIRNQRTLLRRNWKRGDVPDHVLAGFRQDIEAAQRVRGLPQLLGIEGNAAARYFACFASMLGVGMVSDDDDAAQARPWAFDFEGRNRRPPKDRVNALLSYGYSLLTRHLHVTLSAVGFDPYRGFYHQPRYGRPALALDLMEPFRPIVVDSVFLTAINNGEIRPNDFVEAAGAVQLSEAGRRALIGVFERRMGQEILHPVFGYQAQYRQIVELQCRLLGRHLLGEIDEYPNFVTR